MGSSQIVIYRRPQTLQSRHLGPPIGAMVAIGGSMGHFVGQGLRHGETASVVTEKSDQDLATREIDKPYRFASRREARWISTSLCLPIPDVVNRQDFVIRKAPGEVPEVELLKHPLDADCSEISECWISSQTASTRRKPQAR